MGWQRVLVPAAGRNKANKIITKTRHANEKDGNKTTTNMCRARRAHT